MPVPSPEGSEFFPHIDEISLLCANHHVHVSKTVLHSGTGNGERCYASERWHERQPEHEYGFWPITTTKTGNANVPAPLTTPIVNTQPRVCTTFYATRPRIHLSTKTSPPNEASYQRSNNSYRRGTSPSAASGPEAVTVFLTPSGRHFAFLLYREWTRIQWSFSRVPLGPQV